LSSRIGVMLAVPAVVCILVLAAISTWNVASAYQSSDAAARGSSAGTSASVAAFSTSGSKPANVSPLNCLSGWEVVSSPSPGLDQSRLYAVSALSSTDVWAVGRYFLAGGSGRALIEHWDGSQWSVVPAPTIGTGLDALYGVAALAPNDVWAVGENYTHSSPNQYSALAMHWDGSSWTLVPTANPSPAGRRLHDIAAPATGDVWAVGTTDATGVLGPLVEHWDGTRWTIVPTPPINGSSSYLYAVTAISPDDVWVAGSYNYGGIRPLTMHWDGTSWTIVPTPDIGIGHYNEIMALAGITRDDVWAVVRGGIIMHWNGNRWSVVAHTGGRLYGIAAVSANDVWAVGNAISWPYGTLLEHWDGHSWTRISGPSVGRSVELNAVAVSRSNPSDFWAVGYYWGVDTWSHTFTQRYVGVCPPSTVTPSPTPDPPLIVAGMTAVVPDGDPNALYPMDIQITLFDYLGNRVEGANVSAEVFASGRREWQGSLADVGNGIYRVCDVGEFEPGDFNRANVVITAEKPGYSNGGYSDFARRGDICTLPGTSTPTMTPTRTPTLTATPQVTPTCTPGVNYAALISSGATVVPGTDRVPGSVCNSCTVQVNLPFSYSFYGTPYSQVSVSNKGVLQFASNSSNGSDSCLPNTLFNDAIFAYWDDHNTNINDTMGIYTSTTGTAPNRIFNIEWRAGYVANDVRSRFEVRLYEGEPKFEVIYANTRRGFSATVGVQKGTGERLTQYGCNINNSVPDGTKITFDQRVCAGMRPTKP